ncbi:MAG: hypothetical protein R6X15_00520 [Pseudomonadota bacterium]
MEHTKGRIYLWVAAFVAIAFGVLTIKSGAAVLFFDGEGRAAAGDYVPFVLWFNFVAGFFYVLAGVGLLLKKTCAANISIIIALATLSVFAAFGVHVINGGAYEMRTVIAMSLRSLVWLAIAVTAWYWMKSQRGVAA